MSGSWAEEAHIELLVESWSDAARNLLLRGVCKGGPFAEVHTTNANKSKATSTFQMHGLPVQLQIAPETAGVQRGRCYVRLSLMIDGEPVQRLVSAYLTDGKTLSWPPGLLEGFEEGPGYIHGVTGTNPAAGAEVAESVPTNTRWRIIAVLIRLVTDATVSSRLARFFIDDGTNTFFAIGSKVSQTASQDRSYSWAPVGFQEAAFVTSYITVPMPSDLTLRQGWRFATNTQNIQAGDNYDAPYLIVEEWIEE